MGPLPWPLELGATVGVVGASTGGAWLLFGRQSLPDVAMTFLLGVVVVATRLRFAAAILAAALSVLSYDFFFIPPYLSFMVHDPRHVVTFGVMFLVAVVISTLTQRLREQASVAREVEAAQLEVETERLRSSLLSSVSHDLRTPLAVITGAATTLLEASTALDAAARRDLLAAIHDEAVRLTRLVANLLDMTRLTAGAMKVAKEWQPIEAVVGAALGRMERRLGGRPLRAHVPLDLPLVPLDAVLVEQVLINLLENAAAYSPAGAPIDVSASAEGAREILVEVADRGPGVPASERPRIFERFHRVPGSPVGGAGLGLAICQGIVEAHGGHLWVVDREGGGAAFRFTVPIEGTPPVLEEEGSAT